MSDGIGEPRLIGAWLALLSGCRQVVFFQAPRVAVIWLAMMHPTAGQTASFEWESASPASQGMDAAKLEAARDALAERRTKALLVIRRDRVVLEWYAQGHGAGERHYSASLAKALTGGLSLAIALNDGKLALDDRASEYVPSWRDDPRKRKITLRQLATHSSGIEDAEDQASGKSHDDLPGWKGDFWKGRSIEPLEEAVAKGKDPFSIAVNQAPAIFEPGTDFAYSNPGMAVLAYAVTKSLAGTEHEDLRTLLAERVMKPIGIPDDAWSVGYGRTYRVDGLPLVANWGGGAFTARAVARLGRLVLRKGDWEGRQLIDPRWIETMTRYEGTALPPRPPENPYPAPALGWYGNTDGVWPDVPRDAVTGAGAGNQVLAVIPSLDLIIVRNGESFGDQSGGEGFWMGIEKYLLEPIVAACDDSDEVIDSAIPYPPSPVIRYVDWAPIRMIKRAAPGGDNWPMTWADDGHQYTAYGDGNGFEPFTERKLSMGFARVEGGPEAFNGVNIRSETGETIGDGPRGKKASGLLMLDGVLYVWARNAGNSQLGWSTDHGSTWEWSEWKFQTSFGAPNFLNFGRDYEGARDGYVYVYSFDRDDAYTAADRMVLARVEKSRLEERDAYEFFVKLDDGKPVWTSRIEERGSVFDHPMQCYRSSMSYHPGLERYLWVHILPGAPDREGRTREVDPRFRGGFGIFDAPEPWGPWTTVYFTPLWDTGPGESAGIPVKWMENDSAIHLVFSGEDSFSVRRGRLVLR